MCPTLPGSLPLAEVGHACCPGLCSWSYGKLGVGDFQGGRPALQHLYRWRVTESADRDGGCPRAVTYVVREPGNNGALVAWFYGGD